PRAIDRRLAGNYSRRILELCMAWFASGSIRDRGKCRFPGILDEDAAYSRCLDHGVHSDRSRFPCSNAFRSYWLRLRLLSLHEARPSTRMESAPRRYPPLRIERTHSCATSGSLVSQPLV